jgi:hypothetical protein
MRRVDDEHVVAVGRAFGDEVGADGPARAGLVLHEHWRAESLRQPRRDQPGGHVGKPSGRLRNDDADGTRRPRLRRRLTGDEEDDQEDAQQFHWRVLFSCYTFWAVRY